MYIKDAPGPVSKQMELALKKTYIAAPEPRLVIACGDCAIDGGVYKKSYAVTKGVANVIRVIAAFPDVPSPPMQIIIGLLELLKRLT